LALADFIAQGSPDAAERFLDACVSTAGLDEETIWEYIRDQEETRVAKAKRINGSLTSNNHNHESQRGFPQLNGPLEEPS
jgi:hypothetical protein